MIKAYNLSRDLQGRVILALHILIHPFPIRHIYLFSNSVVGAGHAAVRKKGTVSLIQCPRIHGP